MIAYIVQNIAKIALSVPKGLTLGTFCAKIEKNERSNTSTSITEETDTERRGQPHKKYS